MWTIIASSLSEGITSNSEVTVLVSIYYPQTDAITPAQSPRKTSVPNTPGKPLPLGTTIEPDIFIVPEKITFDRVTMTETTTTPIPKTKKKISVKENNRLTTLQSK